MTKTMGQQWALNHFLISLLHVNIQEAKNIRS